MSAEEPTLGRGVLPLPVSDMAPRRDHAWEGSHVYLRGSAPVANPADISFPTIGEPAGDRAEVAIGPTGTLYSFSVVHVSASREVPYTIGYVDFDHGARVLAQIQADPSTLKCDQRMELCAEGDRWWVAPVAPAEEE